MTAQFESEQAELQTKIEKLKAELAESRENDANVDSFISEVKQIEDITELDAELLHRLIGSIRIGSKYEVDGKIMQDIIVEYKFIGKGI